MLKREAVDSSTIRVILRDGRSLKVRPISPQDREKLRDLFYRLSPQTRYFRFGYMKTYISEEELTYFAEVDPPDVYAYVALTGEGEDEKIVAVGRWFLNPDRRTAEISFVVEDKIQVRGVGTALLEQLVEAALRYKIKAFVARILLENTRMMEVFEESGFKIGKKVHEDAYEITFDLEEQEEYDKRQAHREHIARSAGVRKILCPGSVAVIGASRDTDSVGGKVFRNLLHEIFSGPIFPVNPKSFSVGGVLCYASVDDVPADVDLAVVVIPAAKVLDIVDECGKKGVAGLIIISAGFAESGPEGKERQRQLREKILSYGMRCVGPNCLGVINTDPAVNLNATFCRIKPRRGGLSISSHSGALGLALLDYAKGNDLGIAHFASIGNRVDISSNDLMEFWEDDEYTKVILLYLESFGNPRKFSRIARRVSRTKPIIALKAGRSDVGRRAASSHTGALAASDIAVDALFRQAGVIRVNTIEEMFNVAKSLVDQPIPKGPRVAILTNAGGPGVLAADAAIGLGLSVPTLSEETQRRLKDFLPREAAFANPVDMIASAPGEHFERGLKVLLDDLDIDAILVMNVAIRPSEEIAAGIRRAMTGYEGDKTVIASFLMSEAHSIDLRYDGQKQVPLYAFPEDAILALSHAYPYGQHRSREEGHIPVFADISEERARKYLEAAGVLTDEGCWLPPEVATGLFKEYGIPAIDTRAAFSAEEAADCAEKIGFPVVMKLRSKTITHKTDVGGIILGLKDDEEVRQAFDEIRTRLKAMGRGAEMEGVILQPMIEGGQEVIVGMSQDPVFGPLMMVGLGGIHVELIKDVAFSLHPLRDGDPDYMLSQLKSLPLLQGWRGSPPKDIDVLKDVLLRFSALIEDFTEIAEVEINPLIVFDKGKGCAVVDARVLCKKAGDH
ncbi:MAG TPA: GNAT family N-acetyltransferase [Thermodesulfovibrionales bacterium]|nr:GNAT family N-acetyltransferase [Thermodesulfovibrionales bacterium]